MLGCKEASCLSQGVADSDESESNDVMCVLTIVPDQDDCVMLKGYICSAKEAFTCVL